MSEPCRIVFRRTGGPEVLERERIGFQDPAPRDVLLRHEAIGLNFIDTYHRSGLYPVPLPSGLGTEAAGVIEAVGEQVTEFKRGDRVGYFSGPLGAYATHRLIAADLLVRLPDWLSAEQAAATLLKGCTAEFLIEHCAKVEPGQWVFVHAGAGGVGSILIPWLKSIGAKVIAHTGSDEKAKITILLGADHSLVGPLEDIPAEVLRLTGQQGVAVVFDGVGAASWQASLAMVSRRGLVISYGNASGPVPPFTALDLLRAGSIFVTRPTLADYTPTADSRRAAADRLFEMLKGQVVKLHIGARFLLGEAAQAHRAIESRMTTGSTILIP